MVNTLGNAPEKVTTTPNRSGSSMLKKIVAGAIALTLSGQPAEIKAFNKQEFPTEMVANVPGTVSPMTENIEQSSVTNYINKAENGVKKYYPQYEQYFKEIIKDIKGLGGYGEYLINKEINRNLILLGEELNEKGIITSVLISLEKITEKNEFNTKNGIPKNSIEYEIGKQVTEGFYYTIIGETKKIEGFRKEMELRYGKLKTQGINGIEKEYIEISEKYMQQLKNRLLNYGELYREKDIQNRIKTYIETLKRENRKPSQIGQKYIDEYNKIKK